MTKLVAVIAFTLMCGPAFAQDTGPAPQTGMEHPGMTKGAREDGSMKPNVGTTGMNRNGKGTMKKDMSKDGSASGMSKDGMKK